MSAVHAHHSDRWGSQPKEPTPLVARSHNARREVTRMRTYERPTLTAVGSFKKTGLGTNRGPERILPLRFAL